MLTSPVPLSQDPICGPSIATPDHGHGAFSVSCSTVISAPPLKCLEIVLDSTEYPKWNTFCPNVIIDNVPSLSDSRWDAPPELRHLATQDGALFPGVDFQFEVALKVGETLTKTSLRVSRLERFDSDGRTGYRVAWTMRGGWHYMMRAERVQEFIASEDGLKTEYYCYETFGGVLAYPAQYLVGPQVADGFGRWMRGLKERAQGQMNA